MWHRSGWALAILACVAFLAHLYVHDPEKGGFISCPFRILTGLLCPGCGSQRAIHDLMHFRLDEAARHNALLVMSLPVLAVQWGYARLIPTAKPLSSRNSVVWAWLLLTVGWSICRNLFPGAYSGH